MKTTWETKRLEDVAELRGRIGWKGLSAKEYTPDGPYFLSVHSLNYGDYVDFRDAFHISQERYDESPEIMLQPNDVLICKDGAGIGKVGIVGKMPGPTSINSSMLLIRAKPNILPKYLYFILQSPYFQRIVKSRLEGATTPHLYQRDIATFPIYLPPLEDQRKIVSLLDEACDVIAATTATLKAQLELVGDLKQSLLAQAFTGDLGNAKISEAPAGSNDNFATPKGAAQVIAFAYWLHKKANRDKSYKHVKAQKCLHNVENIAAVDLGRQPRKFPYGPHDPAHMARAEAWAREHEFFEFVPSTSGPGLDFKKLTNYDALWEEAVIALKPVNEALERAIAPLVSMNMEEAELFATVHAAWNNLLIDGAEISDDAIVREARENWDTAKTNISRHKFLQTIELIKNKRMQPDGAGKYVGGQGGLF